MQSPDFRGLAVDVVDALAQYADEIERTCQEQGVTLHELSEVGQLPDKPFIGCGWMNDSQFGGGVQYASYNLSRMLGDRGFERNRVSHFSYEARHSIPEKETSVLLAEMIKTVLDATSFHSDERRIPHWGRHYLQTRFDLPEGVYLLSEGLGNPFGNYRYEPHFTLYRRLVIADPKVTERTTLS